MDHAGLVGKVEGGRDIPQDGHGRRHVQAVLACQADAERVDCPILLIQGEDDPYGTLDQLERIEANVAGPVRRLIVPGGHNPHVDSAESVLHEIVRFLDG